MNEHDIAQEYVPRRRPRRRFDRQSIVRGFAASIEAVALDPGDADRIWIEELLDMMESAGWTWIDLDLALLEAVLFDGFGWTIEHAPDDPARVAAVLAGFLSYAGREHGAPHAEACCDYLRSPEAAEDIARWVRPFDEVSPDPLFAELSAPYNWCDGRCDRCTLVVRCPVASFDLEGHLDRGGTDAANGEGRAAAATATATAAMCAAIGGDPAGPAREPDAESPAAARLRHAGREYAAAVFALRDALAAADPARDAGELDELGADAVLVAVKGGRIAGYLSEAGALEDQAALMDGVPNLLLVERVMDEVDQGVGDRSHVPGVGSAYRVARDELRQLLGPHLRRIPERHRDEIRLRIASGGAPSPFSTSA